MADTIKIYTFDVDVIKIGNANVDAVYVGIAKVYPQSTPVFNNYLRTVSRDTGTISLTIGSAVTTSSMTSISYSLDSGDTWVTTANTDEEAVTLTTPTIASGDTVYWKGDGIQLAKSNNKDTSTNFSATTDYDVEGNIMSLLAGDNFENAELDSGTTYHFSYLFANDTHVINASGMTIPSMKMYGNDCNDLFRSCTNLVTAPSVINPSAYNDGQDGYFKRMFYGCTSLTVPPSLPNQLLGAQCYANMFQGCTSLTTAPSLPATTLVDRCYLSMFSDCTSLTIAPSLPATTLVYRCYWGMFSGCTSLNYIKCLATDISATNCTGNWVFNVASSGTFTKAESMTSWTRGNNGIPSGWLVFPTDSFAITSLAANNTITLTNNRQSSTNSSFSYSLDKGATWTDFTLSSGQTKTIATINSGDTIHLKGSNDTLASNYNYGHYFRGSGDYEISGEISSLINGNDSNTDIGGASRYTFAMLFSGDTHLVSAENLKVSSEILPQHCFNSTFRACTRLTLAPELPSTSLGNSCYSSMFEGCIALSKVPSEIRFTTVGGSQVFQRMFCMSRTSKVTTPSMTESPKLFGDWGSVTATNQQMFCGNGNLTKIYCYWTKNSSFSLTNWVNYTADSGVTFYKRSTATFAWGVNGIKTGWTVVNDDSTT